MQTAPTPSRPDLIENDPDARAAYDWLASNGINEWIPENPDIVVDLDDATITLTVYQWHGTPGWDVGEIVVLDDDVATEKRTVLLAVPPDDATVEAARRVGATVTVVG